MNSWNRWLEVRIDKIILLSLFDLINPIITYLRHYLFYIIK